ETEFQHLSLRSRRAATAIRQLSPFRKVIRLKLSLAIPVLLILSQRPAAAQSAEQCAAPDKRHFEKMNGPMFVDAKATAADVAAYERTKDEITERLHQFLMHSIFKELGHLRPDEAARDIPRWMDCVQSGIPQYRALKDSSNVPAAYVLPGTTPQIIVLYAIDRGYEAIPQLTYFLEAYSLKGSIWQLLASKTPHQFDAGWLNSYHVRGSTAEDYRLLLVGKHYGDTGARLHLQLLAFDGRAFKELWSEVKDRTWVVKVTSDVITLGTEAVDKNGHNAHDITKSFRIENEGLKALD
ncbi:MAG: hypothetical protein WBE73_04280, partial [Candidatus Acidiferrum sp.]